MIIPMERVRIVGVKSMASRVLSRAAKEGAIHLSPPERDPLLRELTETCTTVTEEDSIRLRSAEIAIARIGEALAVLPVTEGGGDVRDYADWLAEVTGGEIAGVMNAALSISAENRALDTELKDVSAYRELFFRFQPMLEKIESLRGMEVSGVTFPSEGASAVRGMEKALEDVTGGACAVFPAETEDNTVRAALIIYPRNFGDEVRRRVFGQWVKPYHVPEKYERKTFAETLKFLFTREMEITARKKDIASRLEAISTQWRETLLRAKGEVTRVMTILSARRRVANSEMTFWITGWIPAERVERFKTAMSNEFGDGALVLTRPPAQGEFPDAPVLLRNGPWVKPFERLLNIYALPMYGTCDPTRLMVVTVPILFGMMLGDVGYAAMLGMLCYFVSRRFSHIPVAVDAARIGYFFALWSFAFGVVYAEFFGRTQLWPAIIDRKAGLVQTLIFAVFAGGAHLAVGSVVGAVTDFQRGAVRHGLGKTGDFAIIATGMMAAASYLHGGPGWTLALPVCAVVYKIAVAGFAEGLLETPKLLANALSYSRLMALGLASVILADIAGEIRIAMDAAVPGMLVAVAIHCVNFAIGVFGPTIHAVRLHFVECFARFFVPGGVAYSPLTSD